MQTLAKIFHCEEVDFCIYTIYTSAIQNLGGFMQENKKRGCIMLTPKMWEQLKKLSHEKGVSMSVLISLALQDKYGFKGV